MRTDTLIPRSLLGALLLFLTACGGGDVFAQAGERSDAEPLGQVPALTDTSTAAALSGAFRGAASAALPSVVTINVTSQPERNENRSPFPFPFPFEDRQPQEAPPRMGMGSGFVFSESGHIITNNHVVANATHVEVRFPDGRVYRDAEVVGRDPNTDIAVLKIEPQRGEAFKPLTIGDSERLQVGDWVLALGNPLSLGFTVTAGIVSAKGRNLNILPGATALESFIQTDAAINRGNSGGPLVDLYGRVVGVNTAIYSPTGTYAGNGFAVPSVIAERAARDLIEHGYVRRPMIGVSIMDVGDAHSELYGLDRIAGAFVSEVTPDGPAAEAGIRPEDIIIAVDGEPVDNSTELTTRLAQREPGEEVTLAVIRRGDRISVDVELGEFETEQVAARTTQSRQSAEQVLGFAVSEISPQIAADLDLPTDQGGVVVTGISQFSAAPLARGDVIVEFNRQPIGSVRDFQRAAGDVEPGDVVVLRVISSQSGNEAVRTYRVR